MIRHTFCHIPGVGPHREQRLWSDGICSWDDVFGAAGNGLPAGFRDRIRAAIEASEDHLQRGNIGHFASHLPADQQWRLYGMFQDRCVYLDIETTGGGYGPDHVTVMSLYDGREIRWFVWDDNLEQLPEVLDRYPLVVTFNGKCFDIPFLVQHHGLAFHAVHIDLRFVLAKLGFRGGLKRCEQALGMSRGALDGVDGYTAVWLWREYLRTHDQRVLDTLLAYNVADTVNLAALMREAWNRGLQRTPFAGILSLPPVELPPIPFTPSDDVLAGWRAFAERTGYGL
ncbi:MAG: hypothetical protein A2498_08595 [Lentisphaerae bacterium RIFOXYC12_FULL_60_16]|nr:MAG: hypothetical protein A2498_08595 [Lentisphaerae bacterium RIFOXYC12_FULL_60_16]OGV77813.1 MAG: hypothetical protein A2340_00985 [Lentisphaerae bacterium RIFOXYB12_FULL_60_10]